MGLAVELPVVDPDELGGVAWDLALKRDRVEVIHPAA
jgi:hypothetical protein